MKRSVCILLALCLLLPAVASAESWARLNQRIATRSGPGTAYTEPGTFLRAGEYVNAVSRAWDDVNGLWWVQVEFEYRGDLIRAYTGRQRLEVDLAAVPVEQPIEDCYLLYDADAFAGPGIGYLLWNETIHAGTSATLLAVENGYGQIECWSWQEEKPWRVWVDLDTLSCGWRYGGGSLFDSEDWQDTDGGATLLGPGVHGGSASQPGYTVPAYYAYLPEIPWGGITADCGNEKSIMWVQQCLRSCGYGKLAVDGRWGSQTTSAVRQFRADHGYGAYDDTVTREIACRMLDVFYQKGMPLSYLQHYLAE